jgi:hypothetical protein
MKKSKIKSKKFHKKKYYSKKSHKRLVKFNLSPTALLKENNSIHRTLTPYYQCSHCKHIDQKQ